MFKRRVNIGLNGLRAVTLLLPPAGLALLWMSNRVSRKERILGSIGIPCFGLLHFIGVLWFLHLFAGIDLYEWRGGYYPTVTFHATRTDYEKLDRHRARALPPSPSHSSGEAQWVGFRGHDRDGVCRETGPHRPSQVADLKLVWKQPCGGGYASFAIAHGVAFTIEQRREQEVVVAYDLASGAERWQHAWEARFNEPIGGEGPRATPTWNEGRLYAQGATGELRCLDASTGALIWRHDVCREFDAAVPEYGYSASPLLVDDLVITTPGGGDRGSVVAFDSRTGVLRWGMLDDKQGYVSPTVVELDGQRQILVVAAKRTLGLSIQDGRLLWEFSWGEAMKGRNVAQPVVWEGKNVFLSAGYDTACVALRVQKAGGAWTTHELWRNKFLKNKFSSSIHWKGRLYGLDEDILTCLDASTGARCWKDGRYGYGQIVLADGVLVILCGNGDIAQVEATPERHQELQRVRGIEGKTWNHPAMSDGRLLIRNATEMACFQWQP